MVRGSWRLNRIAIYWPLVLWSSVLCLSCSPGLLNRRPSGPALCWMMAFFTASYQQLLWTPTQSGAPRAPSAWCGFPYHISFLTPTVWLLSWLSYIIVQRPLNRPLNLWNGMFNRHQAEITVMQFRGHSLPVPQSMSLSWDFLPCPISSANFRLRDFFRLLAIGMCHFLPVHHLGMASLAGSKVKIQHYFIPYNCLKYLKPIQHVSHYAMKRFLWSNNCLQRVIIISYLIPYNCANC